MGRFGLVELVDRRIHRPGELRLERLGVDPAVSLLDALPRDIGELKRHGFHPALFSRAELQLLESERVEQRRVEVDDRARAAAELVLLLLAALAVNLDSPVLALGLELELGDDAAPGRDELELPGLERALHLIPELLAARLGPVHRPRRLQDDALVLEHAELLLADALTVEANLILTARGGQLLVGSPCDVEGSEARSGDEETGETAPRLHGFLQLFGFFVEPNHYTMRAFLRMVSARMKLVLTVAGLLASALVCSAQTGPVVLLSIDGLKPDYVLEANRYGLRIPNLRRLLAEGVHATAVSGVLPTVTYPSHATLLTGVSPAKHGITGNRPFDPFGTNLGGWFWYAADIHAETLWDAARTAGLSTASVDWPVSVGAPVTHEIAQYWRAGNSEDVKLIRALSTPGLLEEAERALGPYPDGDDYGLSADRRRSASRSGSSRKKSRAS